MSNYGSRVDSKGNAVAGDSSFISPVAGERVEGNTIESIALSVDKEGNTVESRATVVFKQANGAKVKVTFFEPSGDEDKEWQFDALNKNFKHIATKVISEEAYYEALEKGGAPKDFAGFVKKHAAIILPLAAGKVFTMKFVYSKGYVSVPKFPNWIATPDKADTLTTDAKYDKYVAEEATSVSAAVVAGDDVF